MNTNDIVTGFMANLEELHKEAFQMQSDLQQASNERIQKANEVYQTTYESEQTSLNNSIAEVQKNPIQSEKEYLEVHAKISQMKEDFFKSINEAQEKFNTVYQKINDEHCAKNESNHKELLSKYIKMYQKYNAEIIDIISKSVEANDPSTVIMACQLMIPISQDALAKGIHIEE